MGHFCKFHCELVSVCGCVRQAFRAQIQESLLRRQLLQQVARLSRGVQQSVSAQEHGRIGQQSHAPGQTQAVEKHLAQTQWVFLIGLCRLNPRAHLLKQSLGRRTGQRQQAQQRLMVTGSERKLRAGENETSCTLQEELRVVARISCPFECEFRIFMAKMPVTQLENAYLQRFNLETSHRKCPVRCCQSSVIAQHHNAPKLLLSTDLTHSTSDN